MLCMQDVYKRQHLDTVCTQVDCDKFTIHPGILGSLRIYEITKGDKEGQLRVVELDNSLPSVLAAHLGLDKVTMIHCGGKDRVASEREPVSYTHLDVYKRQENSSTDDKTEKNGRKGAFRGTAYHRVLECLDLTAVSDQKKLEAGVLDLYQRGFLTEEAYESIFILSLIHI